MELYEIYDYFLDLWYEGFGGIGLWQILVTAFVLTVTLLLRKKISKAIVHRCKVSFQLGDTLIEEKIVDTVVGPLSLVIVLFSIYLSFIVLNISPLALEFPLLALKSLGTFTLFWVLYRAINNFSFLFKDAFKGMEVNVTRELRRFSTALIKVILIVVAALMILETWGINTAPLLGGVGILAVAVGLAAKNTFSGLLSSFTLLLEKNFKQGDWIKYGDTEGFVEDVRLRTTVIRQFDRSLLVVPNEKLAGASLVNCTVRPHIRVRCKIGVRLSTSSKQLRNITKKYHDFLLKNKEIQSDTSIVPLVVCVDDITDESIDILLNFFTMTNNFIEHLTIREDCLIKFKEVVEGEGAHLTMPTRYVERE